MMKDRIFRILMGEMVKKLVAASEWRKTKAPNKEELAKELDLELSGLIGFAVLAYGGKREEYLEFAKKIQPWNPATTEGLAKLYELGLI